MSPFEPGSRVVIRENPHHPAAVDVLGTVVAFRPGAGFGGSDLVDVEYEDPRDGSVHELPFAADCLSPGEPAVLRELAERYEALAGELRRLAEGAETGDRAEAVSPAYDRGVRLAREVLATTHPEDAPVLDDETAREMFPALPAKELAHLQRGYADEVRRAPEEWR